MYKSDFSLNAQKEGPVFATIYETDHLRRRSRHVTRQRSSCERMHEIESAKADENLELRARGVVTEARGGVYAYV